MNDNAVANPAKQMSLSAMRTQLVQEFKSALLGYQAFESVATSDDGGEKITCTVKLHTRHKCEKYDRPGRFWDNVGYLKQAIKKAFPGDVVFVSVPKPCIAKKSTMKCGYDSDQIVVDLYVGKSEPVSV